MSAVIDLRPNMPAIFDQGTRPTCLAASACDVNQYGRPHVSAMSVEHFFYVCSKKDRACLHDGINPSLVSIVLKNTGGVDHSFWPYNLIQPVLHDWGPPSSPPDTYFRANLETIPPDFESVKRVVICGIPVIIGLNVYESLIKCPSSGLLSGKVHGMSRGRHAMVAVAVEQNPTAQLCLRNSWGVGWGAQGHAWMDKTYFEQCVFSAHIIPESSKTIWPN